MPKCPYCGETLEGCGFPLPAKGTGKCPNAGDYDFEAEVDATHLVKDKDGNLKPSVGWKVEGDHH